MKKPLLKPPQGDGEILFLSGTGAFEQTLHHTSAVATCHQLAFFHPGIAIRFHLIDAMGQGKSRILFMDTDRTVLQVRLPNREGRTAIFNLISSDRPLCQLPLLGISEIERFFREVEKEVGMKLGSDCPAALREYRRFMDLFIDQGPRTHLRERLAQAFIRFSGIDAPHTFLSELLKGRDFRDFFMRIVRDARRFRKVYNESLERYGEQFRFRYRNFPFPRLNTGELPFWVVRNGKRQLLNMDRFDAVDLNRHTILPKASPLTLFLRLSCSDVFVHGVGGANYEWVNDRILEEFFGVNPSPYFILSATFHLCGIPERDFPYFFKDPGELREKLCTHLEKSDLILP